MLTIIILLIILLGIIKTPQLIYTKFFNSIKQIQHTKTNSNKQITKQTFKTKYKSTIKQKGHQEKIKNYSFHTLNDTIHFIISHIIPNTVHIRISIIYKTPKESLEHYAFILAQLYKNPNIFTNTLKKTLEKTLEKYEKPNIIRYEVTTLTLTKIKKWKKKHFQ